MRSISAVVTLILVLAATSSMAEDAYRAGYEIDLRVGESSWVVRTRSRLSFAEPIRHDFSDYEVAISLDAVSDSTYSITVSVKQSGNPSASSVSAALLENSFDGSFKGILEFAAKNELVDINGAIAISPIG